MRKNVKILVVGDEKVGKSSLISTFVAESFPAEVPSVLPEIQIPPELTAENVSLTITGLSRAL